MTVPKHYHFKNGKPHYLPPILLRQNFIIMSLFYREKEMPLAATEILGPPTSVPFKSLLPESSSFCTLFHLDAPNMLWNVKLSQLQKLIVRETAMQESLMFSPLNGVHEFLLRGLCLFKGIPTPCHPPSPFGSSQLDSGNSQINNFQITV